MAFLDWLTGKMDCPRCGTSGAKKIKGQVHCPNPTCTNYSRTMGEGAAAFVPTSEGFAETVNAPSGYIVIQYIDFRGQSRTFIAEIAKTWREKNHISAKVKPKGARITLSRDRIRNLADVEEALPQRDAPEQDWPTRRERQVLLYHQRNRSTSPLYESIRAKYPNW